MVLERDGVAAREWWQWARMGAAITAESPEAARFAGLGAGSYLAFPQGVLNGCGRIRIGEDCVINEHVTLATELPGSSAETDDEKPEGDIEPWVVLGDRCVLGRGTEILAMVKVELGEDVWTASRVTIVDHHHSRVQPDVAVGRQPLRTSAVTIGRGSVISTAATILAGAQIGDYCMIAAGSVVGPGHYPAHSLLAGIPAGIKPFGSRPVEREPYRVPLDIPALLVREHPDPDVQDRITLYLDAHAAAARTPSLHTYRAAGEQAAQLQAALVRVTPDNDPNMIELRDALLDRANEFARQASLFPRP